MSRPLLKYGEPEGLLVDFFRDINRLMEGSQDILEIKPTEDLLHKIKQWHTFYYNSFPNNMQFQYDDPCNILSDLRILMCVYFQTYCGYFTCANLDCEKTRNEYFNLNQKFITKTKKMAYVKIDIEVNKLDNIYWEYTPTKNQTDFVFSPSLIEQKWKSGFSFAKDFGIRYHYLPEGEDSSFFLCKELIPGYLDGVNGAVYFFRHTASHYNHWCCRLYKNGRVANYILKCNATRPSIICHNQKCKSQL